MNQVFRTRIFNASNSFSNPTLIKKRMIMMTKERTRALANLKILLVVPALVALLIGFSTCSEKLAYTDTVVEEVMPPSSAAVSKSAEPEPYIIVEHMPKFPGGDTLLLDYLRKNTIYPESAKANNISGKVVVRFCVTETGSIDRISILKGVSPELDAEAARVVSTLPAFEPGTQGDKAVPVWYMVPITFGLKDEKTATPPPPPPPPAGEPVAGIVKETAGKTSLEPYVVVEEMPKFPGGEEALLAYLYKNTNYPAYAKTMNISGQVILRFIVTESGSVEQISVLKGVHPSLDEEAVRVASTLSGFEPGRQKGKAVPVWYMVPITFTLK
jgi:TonB family protein